MSWLQVSVSTSFPVSRLPLTTTNKLQPELVWSAAINKMCFTADITTCPRYQHCRCSARPATVIIR